LPPPDEPASEATLFARLSNTTEPPAWTIRLDAVTKPAPSMALPPATSAAFLVPAPAVTFAASTRVPELVIRMSPPAELTPLADTSTIGPSDATVRPVPSPNWKLPAPDEPASEVTLFARLSNTTEPPA
jgi:hypothetical protein